MAWHAVNAYTRDHQDAYLLEVVRPWLARLAGRGRAYFLRHWQGGPHVSVRTDVPVEAFRQQLAPSLAGRAQAWLRERDPEHGTVPERLLQRLGAAEGHAEVVPPRPPGSVEVVEAVPRRAGELGGEAGARLYEAFLVEANGHALEGVELARRHGRLALAFDALVAGPDGIMGDISRFFMCYRSHADGFVMGSPDPARTRAFFDDSYDARREAVGDRLRALLDGVDDPPARWARAGSPRLRDFRDRAATALASGALRPASLEEAAAAAPEEVVGDFEARLEHSPFHKAVWATGYNRVLQDVGEWQAFRLAINYQYAQLSRLGISGIERFLLCHLVACAVQDHLGIDPVEALERRASASTDGARSARGPDPVNRSRR